MQNRRRIIFIPKTERDSVKKKLMGKIKRGSGGCLEWTGKKDPLGYARVVVNKKQVLVHRLMYYLANPDFDQWKLVCHKCDNPKCSNPKHMFIGSQKANLRDCSSKGRIVRPSIRIKKCPQGHSYTEANTYIYIKEGYECRSCITCKKSAVLNIEDY